MVFYGNDIEVTMVVYYESFVLSLKVSVYHRRINMGVDCFGESVFEWMFIPLKIQFGRVG